MSSRKQQQTYPLKFVEILITEAVKLCCERADHATLVYYCECNTVYMPLRHRVYCTMNPPPISINKHSNIRIATSHTHHAIYRLFSLICSLRRDKFMKRV